jgi:hypothetical protein
VLRGRAAPLVLAALAGCGGGDESAPGAAQTEPPARQVVLDERDGTYRGVGLGSTRAEVERVLGAVRESEEDPFAPLGMLGPEVGTPPSPRNPPGAGPEEVWRLRDAALIADDDRAWLLLVSARGTRTRAGVAIGDSLSAVRKAYPRLRCGTANEGTEYVKTPYCAGKIAPGRHIWFGRDPVRSIAVSRAAFT